jgi:hypothetical protein
MLVTLKLFIKNLDRFEKVVYRFAASVAHNIKAVVTMLYTWFSAQVERHAIVKF